jgi:hypothetical protein
MPTVLEPKPQTGTDHAATMTTPTPQASAARRLAFVAPKFRHDPDWPWLTKVDPLSACSFTRRTIVNDFEPMPKLTKLYQQWQYFHAGRAVRSAEAAFLLSYDVVMGMTGPAARLHRHMPCIYMGLHQDSPLEPAFIEKLGSALRRCAAVSILTEEERQLYIPRFGLDAAHAHIVPIHTDHAGGYGKYSDVSPQPQPYVLAMGSPNRVFKPTAMQCAKRNIPLVVITRPWHSNDDLDELANLGATVITDADMSKALTYLKHAKLTAFDFVRTEYASGFITLVHSMFLHTPIVAGNCVGIPEHVVDGQTGFVVAHNDPDAMGRAIERIWSDAALASQLAQQAALRAQQRHSLEAAAEAYARIAAGVIER